MIRSKEIKLLKVGRKFALAVLKGLPAKYDYMRELQQMWEIVTVAYTSDMSTLSFVQQQKDGFQTLDRDIPSFKLNGIEFFNKKRRRYEPCSVLVYKGLINAIQLNEADQLYELDLTKFRLSTVSEDDFKIQNPDRDRLLEIIAGVDHAKLTKIDLDSTFSIAINGKEYFTIIDMEDGDYIAIDSQKRVYRMRHDSHETVSQIHDSFDVFLNEYTGIKQYLAVHFKA